MTKNKKLKGGNIWSTYTNADLENTGFYQGEEYIIDKNTTDKDEPYLKDIFTQDFIPKYRIIVLQDYIYDIQSIYHFVQNNKKYRYSFEDYSYDGKMKIYDRFVDIEDRSTHESKISDLKKEHYLTYPQNNSVMKTIDILFVLIYNSIIQQYENYFTDSRIFKAKTDVKFTSFKHYIEKGDLFILQDGTHFYAKKHYYPMLQYKNIKLFEKEIYSMLLDVIKLSWKEKFKVEIEHSVRNIRTFINVLYKYESINVLLLIKLFKDNHVYKIAPYLINIRDTVQNEYLLAADKIICEYFFNLYLRKIFTLKDSNDILVEHIIPNFNLENIAHLFCKKHFQGYSDSITTDGINLSDINTYISHKEDTYIPKSDSLMVSTKENTQVFQKTSKTHRILKLANLKALPKK